MGNRKNRTFTVAARAIQSVRFEESAVRRGAHKYSFINFECNRYSTSADYPKCEMWLEIGTNELRILNEKYEVVTTHRRRHSKELEPIIDFENYIEALTKKPRSFLNSPYFLTLPDKIQNFLKSCKFEDLKKMLLLLVPIIKGGKIDAAEAVFDLVKTIRTVDDFDVAYRSLTEKNPAQPSVTTPMTPPQTPYLPNLNGYSQLLNRGELL